MSMHLGEAQIQEGATGLDVKKLQEILNGGGYNAGPIDGIFGAQTLAAVKAFQMSKNIPADGIVGPITWNALIPQTPVMPPPAPVPAGRPAGAGMFSFLDNLSLPTVLALGVGVVAFVSLGSGKKRR